MREADEASRVREDAEGRGASELTGAATARLRAVLDDVVACETEMRQMAVSLREEAAGVDRAADARPGVSLVRGFLARVNGGAARG
jgi:hypothetical protein